MEGKGLQTTLGALGIGTWVIEGNGTDHPRMFLDDTMKAMMAVPDGLSPEEVYDAWLNNVSPHSVKKVEEYMNRLIAGGNAEVEYYWNHPIKGVTLIRCNGARNNDYTDRIRVEGMHRDISTLSKVDQKDDFKSPIRFSEIASSLSQSLDSIFYVNLNDDSYYEFHATADFRNLGVTTTGKNFFEECRKNIKGVTHPEDLPALTDFCSKKYILDSLEKNITPFLEYRLKPYDTVTHYRIKAMYVPDDKSRLVVTVENIETEYKKRTEEKASQEITKELINRFIENYQSVYLINSKTQQFRLLSSKKDINETHEAKSLQRILDLYVHTNVSFLDREKMSQWTNFDFIQKKLKEKNTYSVEYRDITTGAPKWYELNITKLHDDAGEFLIALTNKNEEITKAKLNDTIYSNYSAIFTIDLESNSVFQVLNNSDNNTLDLKDIKSFFESLATIFENS